MLRLSLQVCRTRGKGIDMQLISVNIGQARRITNAKAIGKTGIYKLPVTTPVRVGTDGLTDDAICDIENHGGMDQAVYVYGTTDYAWWSAELERELAPGIFGENLTISDLASADFYIGDQLHIGAVVLEVTAPRVPCVTLAVRMGDPRFVKRFRAAERPGLYCRVLHTGAVQVGDEVSVERYGREKITVIEMFRDFFDPHLDEATLRRYLAAPIATRDRVAKEAQLQELVAQRKNIARF